MPTFNKYVFLIEDDAVLRRSLTQSLELENINVTQSGSLVAAKPQIADTYPGVVVSDIRMPGRDGFDVLAWVKEIDPELPVILLTGEGDVPMAVRAMAEGAYDFLQKPCPPEKLLEVLNRAIDHRQLVLRSRHLETKLKNGDAAAQNFPGPSAVTEKLRADLRQAAEMSSHVYFWGQPGVGKRLAAFTLHSLMPRPRAFRPYSMRELSATQLAHLDVPDGPFDLSIKHLDLATADQHDALISLMDTHKHLRVLASACPPLDILRNQGLASDLFFALDTIRIEIPTLSRRKEDLHDLFESLVRQAARNMNKHMPNIPDDVFSDVLARNWPENLPELRNHANNFAMGTATPTDVQSDHTLAEQMDAFEKLVLSEALRRRNGKASETAEALGLPRKTFYDKLARHSLKPKDFRGSAG
ncbi:sigma-54-dependent transcriptional regulator [Litoreibacter roseus]|uniref:Fis family transcriptional regulator n=1 Tax=Litoreibacter roseus TaxID=2601869 RepID=A0A6N6JD26_9RHOB|nr:response regulator [Litoreibacter roseus]GFE64076.1 Fis family transcriptional regulator [Litoreibacter roseus]